jgi:hypothetical protein
VRYEFIQELIVVICSAVVFALFYYVFNDFLNVEIQQISQAMRDRLGEWAAYLILGITAIFSGRHCGRMIVHPNNLATYVSFMGESPVNIRRLHIATTLSFLAFIYASAWYLVNFSVYQWPPLQSAAILGLMVLLSTISGSLNLRVPQKNFEPNPSPLLTSSTLSAVKAMFHWRFRQMIYRNPLTQICLALAILSALLPGFVAFSQGPLFVAILSAYLTGTLLATALSFQVAYDLSYAWLERNLGVSHDRYMTTLMTLAILIGLLPALMTGGLWLAGSANHGGLQLQSVEEAFKIAVITMIPPWLLPHVVFQIDGRRPAIQIVILILVGLFLITAVYAHWLGLLLLPLVKYYADQSQDGRFYRV